MTLKRWCRFLWWLIFIAFLSILNRFGHSCVLVYCLCPCSILPWFQLFLGLCAAWLQLSTDFYFPLSFIWTDNISDIFSKSRFCVSAYFRKHLSLPVLWNRHNSAVVTFSWIRFFVKVCSWVNCWCAAQVEYVLGFHKYFYNKSGQVCMEYETLGSFKLPYSPDLCQIIIATYLSWTV